MGVWFSWWYACWSSIKISILISNSHVKSSSTFLHSQSSWIGELQVQQETLIHRTCWKAMKENSFNHSLMGSNLHVHIYVHPNPLTSIYICKIFYNVIENFNKSFLIKFNYHKYTGIITTRKKKLLVLVNTRL